MILRAVSRPAGDTAADAHVFEVEADTYDLAFEQARGSVPDGWLLLHVSVVQA